MGPSMPAADVILASLSATAVRWWPVAAAWHAALAILLIALWGRPPLSRRTVGRFLIIPIASVAAFAWQSGNPFNGTLFAVLAMGLAFLSARLAPQPVSISPPFVRTAGLALIAFGWIYPHFLGPVSWWYLVAAPLGLIPCPTLSALVGILLLVNGLGSRVWAATVGLVGVVYGLIGVFRLAVALDLVLLVGAVALLVVTIAGGRRPAPQWTVERRAAA